jgi:hypothetical protein
MNRYVLSALALAAGALVSCSSSSPAGGGADSGADTNPGDLTTPVTTLRANVMPLFNMSCSFSSCHGSVTASKGGIFLGAQGANGMDAAQVRKLLVGVNADEIPTMPYVTAGDPTKSFLMHKMDGDQATLASQCAPPGCQGTMPQGNDPLPAAERNIIRRWIAQGALDN